MKSAEKFPFSVGRILAFLCISSMCIKMVTSFSLPPTRMSATSKPFDVATLVRESTNSDPDPKPEEHEIFVTHEGRTCTILAREDESILSALERAGVPDRLALSSLPSDCRRGNCLTCTGKHSKGSNIHGIERMDDGLSPYVSRRVEESGFILTCSSRVTADGVKLELERKHDAWRDVYQTRLEEEAARYAGRKMVARTIRRADEKNVPRWAKETETALEKTPDEDTTFTD